MFVARSRILLISSGGVLCPCTTTFVMAAIRLSNKPLRYGNTMDRYDARIVAGRMYSRKPPLSMQ